jgi:8-oxo-dGTP pyrophosphatase MutT (NUDIX family)
MPAPSTARLIVSAIIEKENKILVLQEPDDEGNPRCNFPGGHVEPGEGIVAALKREVMEETGFTVEPDALIQIITQSWKDGTHSVRQTFLVHITGGELKTETGATPKWLSKDEFATFDAPFVYGIKESLNLAFAGKAVGSEHILLRDKGETITLYDPKLHANNP